MMATHKPRDLTLRQRQVLNTIIDLIDLHGYPPTVRDLTKALHITIFAVADHLKALERKGAIERIPGKARAIRVVGRGGSGNASS